MWIGRSEYFVNPKLVRFEWFIGNACNYDCRYCVTKARGREDNLFLTDAMIDNAFENIQTSFKDNDLEIMICSLGEPTLYPYIWKIIDRIIHLPNLVRFILVTNLSADLENWMDLFEKDPELYKQKFILNSSFHYGQCNPDEFFYKLMKVSTYTNHIFCTTVLDYENIDDVFLYLISNVSILSKIERFNIHGMANFLMDKDKQKEIDDKLIDFYIQYNKNLTGFSKSTVTIFDTTIDYEQLVTVDFDKKECLSTGPFDIMNMDMYNMVCMGGQSWFRVYPDGRICNADNGMYCQKCKCGSNLYDKNKLIEKSVILCKDKHCLGFCALPIPKCNISDMKYLIKNKA